jgi:c-di-GMP-binding flagellar brake protein YcgR
MAKNSLDTPALDYSSKLQIGLKGEIAINAGIYKGHYSSQVEDFKDDTVGLAHPLLKGALLPAYREMNFTFTMEDGVALYVFEMSVRKVDTQSSPPILWANINGYPKRVQRRQFLRIACLWDIIVFHMENEMKNPMTSVWLPAKAIDISLGGYRFTINEDIADDLVFELGDRIFVQFELASAEHMQIGKVTRVVRREGVWEIGVGFDSLPASTEKKLFEYIRQQEIILREKSNEQE